MLKVHYTPGDGKGWALDEDLRQIRRALDGVALSVDAARAEVVHAAFWQNLAMVDPAILARSFVIAHADNPPFFYLRQPLFAAGQTWVNLWVARSREALEQFRALGLPAVHVPYTIDPDLFFPIEDQAALRREFGLPEGAYVIANFHRDSEGANLSTPKLQKAPEYLVAILRRLRDRGCAFHVLLAGPRRHWLRAALDREDIAHTFVGRADVAGDDFGVNILDRRELNRLYNAADLHLVSSRWEGGPQSAMEAAACRRRQLSVPLGVARDILEPASLFRSAEEAAERIADDIATGALRATVEPQFERWRKSHTTETLVRELRSLYRALPDRPDFPAPGGRPVVARAVGQIRHAIKRRLRRPRLPGRVGWNHRSGENLELDERMAAVRRCLDELRVGVNSDGGEPVEIVGLLARPARGRILQWTAPAFSPSEVLPGSVLVVPAVQDAVNFRAAGGKNPVVVLPVPVEAAPDLSPLVVEREDRRASREIWRALAAGRPVVYPRDSAYYEQVFHAGVAYESDSEKAAAETFARENRAELSALVRPATAGSARAALRELLLLFATP